MSGVAEEQGVHWITPGEAIKRLGEERAERDIFRQIITELPSHAVWGRIRPDGFSVNGIPWNSGGHATELTAYDVDSLRLYLAVAAHQNDGSEEPSLRVEIVDLDVEGGLVRLHISHKISRLDDLGEPTLHREDGLVLFSRIRLNEQEFLSTYPNASHARPVKHRARSQPSALRMSEEQIALWIRSCDATDMKAGWRKFRAAHGDRTPKKSYFESIWRNITGHRARGRPKKSF